MKGAIRSAGNEKKGKVYMCVRLFARGYMH